MEKLLTVKAHLELTFHYFFADKSFASCLFDVIDGNLFIGSGDYDDVVVPMILLHSNYRNATVSCITNFNRI